MTRFTSIKAAAAPCKAEIFDLLIGCKGVIAAADDERREGQRIAWIGHEGRIYASNAARFVFTGWRDKQSTAHSIFAHAGRCMDDGWHAE